MTRKLGTKHRQTYGKLGIDLGEGIASDTAGDLELRVVLDLKNTSLLDVAASGTSGESQRGGEEGEKEGGLEEHVDEFGNFEEGVLGE